MVNKFGTNLSQGFVTAGRFAVWALFIAVTAAVAFGVGVPMGSSRLREEQEV